MKRNDYNLEQKIIEDYISSRNLPQTISMIAEKYDITASQVSKILHESITTLKVNRATAIKIGEVAVNNAKRTGHPYKKTQEFYQRLIEIFDQTVSMFAYDILTLKNKRDKYLFLLSTFDDTFSDSDELLFTKEDLEHEIEHLNALIKKSESFLKNK